MENRNSSENLSSGIKIISEDNGRDGVVFDVADHLELDSVQSKRNKRDGVVYKQKNLILQRVGQNGMEAYLLVLLQA